MLWVGWMGFNGSFPSPSPPTFISEPAVERVSVGRQGVAHDSKVWHKTARPPEWHETSMHCVRH